MFGNPIQSTIEQTAWCTYALLQVDPENRAAQNGIRFLLKHQREDGSWQEQCVGIYWEIIGGYADPIYASGFSDTRLESVVTSTPHSFTVWRHHKAYQSLFLS